MPAPHNAAGQCLSLPPASPALKAWRAARWCSRPKGSSSAQSCGSVRHISRHSVTAAEPEAPLSDVRSRRLGLQAITSRLVEQLGAKVIALLCRGRSTIKRPPLYLRGPANAGMRRQPSTAASARQGTGTARPIRPTGPCCSGRRLGQALPGRAASMSRKRSAPASHEACRGSD